MRRLKTSDVFAFMRIASEAHIRDEVKALAAVIQRDGANADAQSVGYDLILSVLDRMGAKGAEKAVYDFLAGVWEIEPQAVADMELGEFGETMKTWATEYVDRDAVRAFFGQLSRLMR